MADPMIDGVMRAMCVHYGSSGDPSDRYVQNLYFSNGGTPITDRDAAADELAPRLRTFFTTAPAGSTNSISKWMPNLLEAADVLFYDLGQSIPRQRFARTLIDNADYIASTPLPGEVAGVLSYRAMDRSARGRGRIFLGPLTGTAAAASSAAVSRPSEAFRESVAGAAEALLAANDGWTWVMVSQRDAAAKPIIGGYVDDAWDTQRSRGPDATERTYFGDVEAQYGGGWLPRE